MIKTDFLVLGAGIAGLSYALKTARFLPDKKVCVISKVDMEEGNTRYAQGGIAAVQNLVEDSFESHLQDTLVAGGGLCDKEIVEMVVREAPERIRDLLAWEVAFDSTDEGNFHLGREGGHSQHRILHSKDSTGRKIQEALIKQARSCANIELLDHYFALDFIIHQQKEEKQCCGAYVLDLASNKIERVYAAVSMLASGGAGQVYGHTTNPAVATGDGIAMAARAGANIAGMEFVQFHPTALYEPGHGQAFLITEALRGFGAELRNARGEAFMQLYDPRGSLAPRDVVARAITQEMHKTNAPHIYLDARQLDGKSLKEHFPMIYEKCLSIGINICTDLIPVVPAAHYFCGGVKTDQWGRTSIRKLYASGECASTGLHGANRLASNSLLEALVFSQRAFLHSSKAIESASSSTVVEERFLPGAMPASVLPLSIQQDRLALQMLMDRYAGIIRRRDELNILRSRLEELIARAHELTTSLPVSVPLWEHYNMLTVAMLVVKAAQERQESVGLHYLAPQLHHQEPVMDQAVL